MLVGARAAHTSYQPASSPKHQQLANKTVMNTEPPHVGARDVPLPQTHNNELPDVST
jgi:hypothetical protein